MEVKINVSKGPTSMNPLGQLPVSNSAQYTLNGMDFRKILRFALTQIIGQFLGNLPLLLGYRYVWNGKDYTSTVITALPIVAEMARRWLTNNSEHLPSGGQYPVPPSAVPPPPSSAAAQRVEEIDAAKASEVASSSADVPLR